MMMIMIQMNSLECLTMNMAKCFNKKEKKKSWIKKLRISKLLRRKILYPKNLRNQKKVQVKVLNHKKKILVTKVLKIQLKKTVAVQLLKKGVEALVCLIKMLKIFKKNKFSN